MTESPLKNILGINRLFVTGTPFFPFLGIYVHTSWTFSITMFICLSKAFTFPSNFLLFLSAIKTSLFALTDLVSNEKGPTLKFSSGALFYYCISTLIIIIVKSSLKQIWKTCIGGIEKQNKISYQRIFPAQRIRLSTPPCFSL